MMRTLAPVLLPLLFPATLVAAQPAFEDMGLPWAPRDVPVEWEAATDTLPAKLKVFTVTATIFSSSTVSNVVALALFKDSNAALAALQPAAKGEDTHFEESLTRKWIGISPRRGRLAYNNHKAVAAPRQPVHGVPDREECLRRTLKLLAVLGIQESDISRDSDGKHLQVAYSSGEIGRFDKQEHKEVTQTVSRGVRLFRAVDGVCFGGVGRCGGLYVDFGNDGEVSELELVWRTLQSKSEVTVAKSDQFRRWISAGQATLDIDDGFDPSQIKRLTITRITPYYLGKDGTEIQKTIFPYAVLTALADLGRTNITVSLNTPIFPQ